VAVVRLAPNAAVEVCLYDSLAAIVKDHQDPKTTSIYARVVDRAQNNPAAAVPVSVEGKPH
jgi:hypothetical protein